MHSFKNKSHTNKEEKQINLIKILLKAFNEFGEHNSRSYIWYNSMFFLYNPTFVMEDKRKTIENFKDSLQDLLKINIEVINPNIIFAKNSDLLDNISHCEYIFLLQFFVNYDNFIDLFNNNEQQANNAYMNFLKVLFRCYADKDISSNDYKLVLKSVLYGYLDCICYINSSCKVNSDDLQFSISSYTNTNKYNNILPMTKMVILLLMGALCDDENHDKKSLSNKMMSEIIMPIILDLVHIDVRKQKLLKNNNQVINQIKEELGIDNLASYVTNDLPIRRKNAIRRFGKRIFESTSNNGKKEADKTVIKSDYISNIINDYTGDNRVAKVGKYLTKPE